MKILAIIGSGRKDGNTARIVKLLEKRLAAHSGNGSLEFRTLHAGDLQPCRGCRVCFDRGEALCPLHDGLPGLTAAMREADCVILASPVYVEDVSGIMKTFIDRHAFVCHRPEFAGKPSYVLTTSGIGSSGHALRTLGTALRTWGFRSAGGSRFCTGALTPEEALESRYGRRLETAARRILRATEAGRPRTPSFLALLVFAVQRSYMMELFEGGTSYDAACWSSQGWFDPRRVYYYPCRVSPLKAHLVRAAARVVSLFLR